MQTCDATAGMMGAAERTGYETFCGVAWRRGQGWDELSVTISLPKVLCELRLESILGDRFFTPKSDQIQISPAALA